MLGEGEGGVEFDPEDPEGLRGVDGRDEGVECVNGNEVFCRRDVRRMRLAGERALPFLHSAPERQHFRALAVIPLYALKRESF
jgi:hypothetical protein